MSITTLWGGVVPAAIARELQDFERELLTAVGKAKQAGIPQGLVVALLHAHAQEQTQQLIGDAS